MLAHAGHWLVNLLYAAPVVAVVVVLAVQSVRDRRRGRDRDAEDAAGEPSLDDVLEGRGS